MSPARFEAKIDSLFSFPVGLFHPLQYAGLSRRTPKPLSMRKNYSGKTIDKLYRGGSLLAAFTGL